MARKRLASWLLAGSLLTTAGRQTTGWDMPLFSRFRPVCRTTTMDCSCCDGMEGQTIVGDAAAPPGAVPGFVPPEGPFPPPPAPVPVPTAPPGFPQTGTQPPRIVPVPQAAPTPYTPTKIQRVEQKVEGPYLINP